MSNEEPQDPPPPFWAVSLIVRSPIMTTDPPQDDLNFTLSVDVPQGDLDAVQFRALELMDKFLESIELQRKRAATLEFLDKHGGVPLTESLLATILEAFESKGEE